MWSLGGLELNWFVKLDNVALIGWIVLIGGLSKVLFPLFVENVGLDWLVGFENTVGLTKDHCWRDVNGFLHDFSNKIFSQKATSFYFHTMGIIRIIDFHILPCNKVY